jgi:lipopolysaccharide transport system permease protein/teichoic acid transport system permease protein
MVVWRFLVVMVAVGTVSQDPAAAPGGWYPMRARGSCRWPVLPFRPVTARSEVPSSFRSSSVRPGPLAAIRIGITETLSRRRLIAYLVRADLRKTGADTLLGNVWWIIDPLLQMLVYWLLVGVILQRNRYEDFPLFIFAAILPWKWFDASVKSGRTAVVGSERLIKQINFPKLVLPLASTMAAVVNFAFGLIPLAALMLLFYPDRISWWLLAIPLIAVVQLVFTMAFTIAMSAGNVFYRDIGNLSRHVLRFWFYLSPTLYGIDQVQRITESQPTIGPIINAWYAINPFTYLLGAYRAVIYEGVAPPWSALAVLLGISCVLLALAVLLFKRLEPSFAKVL